MLFRNNPSSQLLRKGGLIAGEIDQMFSAFKQSRRHDPTRSVDACMTLE
jgi:hypothetical protein